MKVLVVLQCAYGRTEKQRKQLESQELWRRAMWRSHTGTRLKEMIPADFIISVINSTPQIGTDPRDSFPADGAYILAEIERFRPDIILACGTVAQEGVKLLGYDFVAAPHPAWRLLSKDRTAEIHAFLLSEMLRMENPTWQTPQ